MINRTRTGVHSRAKRSEYTPIERIEREIGAPYEEAGQQQPESGRGRARKSSFVALEAGDLGSQLLALSNTSQLPHPLPIGLLMRCRPQHARRDGRKGTRAAMKSPRRMRSSSTAPPNRLRARRGGNEKTSAEPESAAEQKRGRSASDWCARPEICSDSTVGRSVIGHGSLSGGCARGVARRCAMRRGSRASPAAASSGHRSRCDRRVDEVKKACQRSEGHGGERDRACRHPPEYDQRADVRIRRERESGSKWGLIGMVEHVQSSHHVRLELALGS